MTGVVRAALAPLARGSTYRRGIYLLLGGVLLLPYALLTVAFAQLLSTGPPAERWIGGVLLVPTLVVAAVPVFLRGTRALEIAAARWLLDVDLPDPPAATETGRAGPETRLRAALWFCLHLATGGAVGLVLLIAVPLTLLFVTRLWGMDADLATDVLAQIGPGGALVLTVAGIVLLVAVVYAVAGLGALAAVMAPVLLGPSQTERIAALEAQAARLAERNRLARELHDSVGHALTVTTLQAAAAREVLDSDPAFVRRALAAVEDTGRAAMADLDAVLGVLRAGAEDAAPRAPERTLADLDRLVADARTAGARVSASVDGPVGEVAPAVSREGYRIVQEGLTNALRHGGPAPVTLRVAVADGLLGIDVANPLRRTGSGSSRGRGLAGMRERVGLLGGTMTASSDGGAWRVSVRLPAR